MSARGEALARTFEEANATFSQRVEGLTDQQWRGPSPDADEQRPVGVVAYHVAFGHTYIVELIQAAAAGRPVPSLNWEQLNEANAQQARENAQRAQAETLELLRGNGEQVSSALRQLSDAQLDRRAVFPLLGPEPVTTEQLVEALVIGHIGMHQASV